MASRRPSASLDEEGAEAPPPPAPEPPNLREVLGRRRNEFLKACRPPGDKLVRLLKLDKLRRSMHKQVVKALKAHAEEEASNSDLEEASLAGDQAVCRGRRRTRPGPAVDPAMESAFFRYDTDGSGLLDAKELRAALEDIGIRASTAEEKRAAIRLIAEAVRSSEAGDGLDLEEFVELVPKLREAMQEIKHAELEEWFLRGLDERGVYDLRQLQPCLEAVGRVAVTGEDDWNEVLRIFEGFDAVPRSAARPDRQERAPTKPLPRRMSWRQSPGSAPPVGASLGASQEEAAAPSPGPTRFERFAELFHRTQERLTALRREKERQLAQELELSDEQLEEFRPELLELYGLFRRFDDDGSMVLEEEEVMQLLAQCGHAAKGNLAKVSLSQNIQLAKKEALLASKHVPSGDRRVSRAEVATDKNHVNFLEFLHLMRLVRRIDREERQEGLRRLFNHYDADHSGEIAMKEMTRLFRDLNMQPRTREDQLEIRKIFDEIDDDGNGNFAFEEFELLVQRVQERLDRLARIEEEKYATEIGLPLMRARELRKIFHDHLSDGGRVLSVAELRAVMNMLQRRYSSEELLQLFGHFSREDLGGLDTKGFLKMMHAIEVAKTHGQLRPAGYRPNVQWTSSDVISRQLVDAA